jgi:hypothetical protein
MQERNRLKDRAMKTLRIWMIASSLALAAATASAAPDSPRALAIVAPSVARTTFDESGAVVISLAPVPPLGEGDRIVVRVDEQIVVLPAGLTKFALTGVPHGSHILEAIIVNADGAAVAEADSVTFDTADLVWI